MHDEFMQKTYKLSKGPMKREDLYTKTANQFYINLSTPSEGKCVFFF